MTTVRRETGHSERPVIGLLLTYALLAAAAAAGLPAVAGAQSGQSDTVYVAHLAALNATVTGVIACGKITRVK